MTPQTQPPAGKTIIAAVVTVAAVYVYFLIFAQFGFLQAVQAALGGGAEVIRPIMTIMGLAGVVGSVLAAWLSTEKRGPRLIAAGFVLCAGGAVGALGARASPGFNAAALLTGLGTGMTTVTLAGMLRRAVRDRGLGLIIGFGTGLAYAFCNLPGIFDASATTQALLALAAAVVGLMSGSALRPQAQREVPGGWDYTKNGQAAWVLVFLALVGLDSAAFFIIQHTPALKDSLWTGNGRLGLNAGVHLGAAVLAGWAFDRRWLGGTVLLGAGALLLAGGLLGAQNTVAGVFYITGVSIYSVALVFYPARSGRPELAAWVYAVAGWVGSGLGIALAEGRTEVPRWLLLGAAGLIGGALAVRKMNKD